MGRGKSESTPKTLFAKRLNILIGDEKHFIFEKNNLLSAGSVARIFGGAEPVRTTLEAIVKGTGCNAAWLLTGDGEPFYKGKGMGMEDRDEMLRKNLCSLRQSKGNGAIEKWLSGSTNFTLEDWKQWENGEGIPGRNVFEAIADVAGIDVEVFYVKQEVKESGAAEAIFRLQMALSKLQLHLAEAGRHVADQQTLKNFAGLNPLLTSLQNLESPMQALLGPLLSYQRMRAEARNEEPHRPDDGKNHVHTA